MEYILTNTIHVTISELNTKSTNYMSMSAQYHLLKTTMKLKYLDSFYCVV